MSSWPNHYRLAENVHVYNGEISGTLQLQPTCFVHTPHLLALAGYESLLCLIDFAYVLCMSPLVCALMCLFCVTGCVALYHVDCWMWLTCFSRYSSCCVFVYKYSACCTVSVYYSVWISLPLTSTDTVSANTCTARPDFSSSSDYSSITSLSYSSRSFLTSSQYSSACASSLIEEIYQLPSQVAYHQLYDLARVAYEGLRYIFTELDEIFEGLGMMKMNITGLNVCTGPECSYISPFKGIYMVALHIAITHPDSLGSLRILSTVATRFFCWNMPSCCLEYHQHEGAGGCISERERVPCHVWWIWWGMMRSFVKIRDFLSSAVVSDEAHHQQLIAPGSGLRR